jgi:hypothetical protein
MTATKEKYEMTPAELEAKRLEIEQRLIALKREAVKAKWLTAWQITKAVLFPLFVIVGAVGFVVFGALFAILAESFKRVTK